MTDTPTSADLFALFDHLLDGARLKLLKTAKPVLFDLGRGERWLFTPSSTGPQFARTQDAANVLTVRAPLPVLARLVTSARFVLGDDDDGSYDGDIDDLLPIASALDEQKSVLGVRMGGAR
ncbi:MAG TPA: hypothetical protein VGO62_03360 [Myxococcota bacterium]